MFEVKSKEKMDDSPKEYIWFKNYPKVVPHTVDTKAYKSVVELIDQSIQKHNELIAFTNFGKSLTYKQLDPLVNNFASFLVRQGLKKGDRVAIQMPNLLQYPIVLFGALRAGLVVVNTNPLYTSREMKHQFNDSGAKAIIILANFASELEEIIAETKIETVVVTEIGDMVGGLKGKIMNWVVKYIKKMVPKYHLPHAITWKDAMKTGSQIPFKKVDVGLDDLAFLQYTGGTTGVSKGAMLSHGNIIANVQQTSAWMLPKLKEQEETIITALPLYHIFALVINCLLMFKIGSKSILITNPRDMPGFIKELKKVKFTVFTGVNTLFNGLLNQKNIGEVDFSNLKASIGGGMAVQKAVAEHWKEVTGCSLAEGYGLTETSPVATCNPIDDTERLGTIGMPVPNTNVKLVNEEGQEVGFNEPGELCVNGPQVMQGYWKKPEETKATFLDEKQEWLKTGDMATVDEDGFFKIVDRKKEMILVSGFNVYPNEIEDVLVQHPKVLEAGVIGVPDERSTEAVKAFIVKKDESLTEQEIIDFCREYLTAYKVPKLISFKKELPKSNVGKILRRVLKEQESAQKQ